MYGCGRHVGCLSGSLLRHGEELRGSIMRIGESLSGSLMCHGEGLKGSILLMGDSLSGSILRHGEGLRGSLSMVCSVNKDAYLRVVPDVVWLTPDMLSGEFDIYSNVDWKID